MQLTSLPQYVNNANRFSEIVGILAKYGLAEWISDSHPEFIKNLVTGIGGQQLSGLTRAERIRNGADRAGTDFHQAGPDAEHARRSHRARDCRPTWPSCRSNTPADSPETVRETVREELGKSPGELFAEFDLEALASASIGQVHRAKLADGQTVVVKVQHDGILGPRYQRSGDPCRPGASCRDAHARSFEPISRWPRRLSSGARCWRELDFTRELRNLQLFTENFSEDETVHIPEPYPELSSRPGDDDGVVGRDQHFRCRRTARTRAST